MKVVEMDDIEWWVGPSLAECVAAGIRICGADTSFADYDDQHELSDQELQRLTFVDDDGTKRTFAEQLAIEVAAGGEFPRPFAATDY